MGHLVTRPSSQVSLGSVMYPTFLLLSFPSKIRINTTYSLFQTSNVIGNKVFYIRKVFTKKKKGTPESLSIIFWSLGTHIILGLYIILVCEFFRHHDEKCECINSLYDCNENILCHHKNCKY